jgi:O-antigen ligase
MFTLYDRAAGAFKDPNVFGPFLVLPAIFMLQKILAGRSAAMPFYAAILIYLTAGIFLSFSRGAWGLFGLCAILLTGALYLQSSSNLFRLRIIMMGVMAFALLAIALVVALQLPGVADIFSERAQLAQSYDTSRLGRFARFAIGFQMAMEHPLGIGPLEFGQMLGEDTHDIWLKALLDYSWLGFAAYLTLIVWTVAGGFRILFRNRPWQPFLLAAYVVFIGHVLLGTVIDTNHWRHFYLLLGMIWGAMALEVRWQRNLAREAADGRFDLAPHAIRS